MLHEHAPTGQGRRLVRFLAGTYNGESFPFDLTELRGLDTALADACIAFLDLGRQGRREVHEWGVVDAETLHGWFRGAGLFYEVQQRRLGRELYRDRYGPNGHADQGFRSSFAAAAGPAAALRFPAPCTSLPMPRLATLLLLAALGFPELAAAGSVAVMAAECGARWPFTVPSGELGCDRMAVTFSAGGRRYGLDGPSFHRPGVLPVEAILREDAAFMKLVRAGAKQERKSVAMMRRLMGPPTRISVGFLIDRGLTLC